jgi:hypothetical protein
MFGEQSQGPAFPPPETHDKGGRKSLYWRLREGGRGYRVLHVGKWTAQEGRHPLRAGFHRAIAALGGTRGDGADHYR